MAKTKVLRNKKGQEICGAKKHTKGGEICRQTRLGTGGRCKHHGGGGHPPGPVHPLWKNGRGSRFLRKMPSHLRKQFKDTLNDPDVLSLTAEIGLLDSRTLDLIEKLSTRESVETIESLTLLLIKMEEVLNEDEVDIDDAESIIEQMYVILSGSKRDASIWGQILETVEARRKVSDTERRLLEAQQHAIDAVQLRSLITFFLASIKKHVLPLGPGGKEAVLGVSGDLVRLIGDGSQPARLTPDDEVIDA
jgi:hypothetical protein